MVFFRPVVGGIARPRYHGQHVEVNGPEHADQGLPKWVWPMQCD